MRTLAVLLILVLAACGKQEEKPPPGPVALTAEDVAYFCGMGVAEHPGPKAQIWLRDKDKPLWFSQVRDAVAFTLLPEEPKDIRVIWVSDMAKSRSWDQPDAWVDAHKAFYVLDSDRKGGMGMAETVPFSDRAAAEAFTRAHGGHVVDFAGIPADAILATPPPTPVPATPVPATPVPGGMHGH